MRNLRYLLGAVIALALFTTLAVADPDKTPPRVIELQPEASKFLSNPPASQGLIIIREEDMGFLRYSFRANGIGVLCSGFNPVAPETQMLTLFMEFLDGANERFRLLNFNVECNFGRFSGEYFDFPEEVAVADLFARPILFEVLVLTDDGTENNDTPFGLAYIIQGVD